MASPRGTGIQTKHILIALVGILTTLLFIASIVLISIGYMNPFGTVGLGILGGGCVIFFSAVLLLCASSIWIKNKYYPDEIDYGEKLDGTSSEDLKPLKTASPLSSYEQSEDEWVKGNATQGDNRNVVPLYSASTVYSSVSSGVSVFSDNWQRDDAPGATDSDVFSSSLTALQHRDIKSQQRLEQNEGISAPAVTNPTGQPVQKVKDGGERQQAHIAVNDKRTYVIELPQQPVGDKTSPSYYVPHGNYDKQVEKHQAAITQDTYSPTKRELCDRNAQRCPMKNPQTASAFSPKDCKGDLLNNLHTGSIENYIQDTKGDKGRTQQNTQTTDRHGPLIPDPAKQNTRKQNIIKEGIIFDKYLHAVPAGDSDRKHRSRQNIDIISEDRSDIPLQYLLPKSQQGLSSSQTMAEDAKRKVLFTKKAVKPTIRTDP